MASALGCTSSGYDANGGRYRDGVSERDVEAVQAFNDAINARDPDRLRELMSADHRFVDAAGGTVAGRDACVEVWGSFFESFPDYRNVFESIEVIAPGRVQIDGNSSCVFEPLDGPARWHATVSQGLISEWRVEDRPQQHP